MFISIGSFRTARAKLLIGIMSFLTAALISPEALASHSMNFGLSLMTADQKDVNSWVDSLSTVGTKNVPSGYEFYFAYEYRFSSSMFALHFRPSYYMASASGGGVSADLSGLTFFPMLRLYPLENKFMKFFMQVGLGYGSLTTKLENNNSGGSGSYSGGSFGAVGGLGAQFCFTDAHCMLVEGNLRYLPFPRNTGEGSGSLGGSISQASGELEINNSDLATTLSGIQGTLAYVLNF